MAICDHLHPLTQHLQLVPTHTHTHTHSDTHTHGGLWRTNREGERCHLSVVKVQESCSGSCWSVFASSHGILERTELIFPQHLQHSETPVSVCVWEISCAHTHTSLVPRPSARRHGNEANTHTHTSRGDSSIYTHLANWKTSNTNFSILIPFGLVGSTLQCMYIVNVVMGKPWYYW